MLLHIAGEGAQIIFTEMVVYLVHSGKHQRSPENFFPTQTIICLRYEFSQCLQRMGESVEEYVSNLKQIVSNCRFGPLEDELLRDQFLCGIAEKEYSYRKVGISELEARAWLKCT